MKSLSSFISELFRRKVVRLVGAYIVIFLVLAEGYATFYPAFGLPDWTLRALMMTGFALAPVFAWFSWKYDVMPPQIVRDAKDVEAHNPALSWALRRHDNADAGFILLKWEAADGTKHEKRFFKPVSIGRGIMNEIDFADDRVSRHHAVLWAEEGAWRVRDLDSANGTFINRAAVDGSASLPQSCELRFHANGPTIGVHVDKPAETPLPPPTPPPPPAHPPPPPAQVRTTVARSRP